MAPRPRAVPSLLLQISCTFYGAKEWLTFFFFLRKFQLVKQQEMFLLCDPL